MSRWWLAVGPPEYWQIEEGKVIWLNRFEFYVKYLLSQDKWKTRKVVSDSLKIIARRHDDQLFALALACYASKEEEPIGIAVQR